MKSRSPDKHYFTHQLMDWHRVANHRSLPWKGERDPYRIWISEIILQQTRAEQGMPYYQRFMEAYPGVRQLANATDEAAFRLWQGLGYYNRCKHMLSTARQIVQELEGKFPDTYEGLLQLKGVGPYTAAAIASFAYGLPQAVVDGNVVRVLARCFGRSTPFDTTEGKKEFQQLADELLDRDDSAAYNQAIMDLGATVCTPLSPACGECPLHEVCIAFRDNLIPLLPARARKPVIRHRYFHYLLLLHDGKIWIHKREGRDIWQNLFEPFLIECETPLDRKSLQEEKTYTSLQMKEEPEYEGMLSQRLTHQLIETRFFSITLPETMHITDKTGVWAPLPKLKTYPFPKTLVSFFEKKLYF